VGEVSAASAGLLQESLRRLLRSMVCCCTCCTDSSTGRPSVLHVGQADALESGPAVGSGVRDPSRLHSCLECAVGAWALGVRVTPGLPCVPEVGRDDVHVQVEQAGVVDERGDGVVADPVGRCRFADRCGRVEAAALSVVVPARPDWLRRSSSGRLIRRRARCRFGRRGSRRRHRCAAVPTVARCARPGTTGGR
jgi:hypothetical protein